MLNLSLDKKKELTILSLGAHCDDIEIGCGGSMLKIIEEYNIREVQWIVFSSNEVRRAEALISANQFLKDVPEKRIKIEDFRDGYLPFQGTEVKEYFENLKNEIQPDLIFTHYRDDRHQDHRLINELTWNTFRNHFILEYEVVKYDGDFGIPNLFVPLEENMLGRKNEIILNAFASQASKHWFDLETFNALPRLRGLESSTRFAEAFYTRKIVL